MAYWAHAENIKEVLLHVHIWCTRIDGILYLQANPTAFPDSARDEVYGKLYRSVYFCASDCSN